MINLVFELATFRMITLATRCARVTQLETIGIVFRTLFTEECHFCIVSAYMVADQ